MNKLYLDQHQIKKARSLASSISEEVSSFVSLHSTTSIERTILRLLGIDGVNDFEIPYPNVIVDYIKEYGDLSNGVSIYIASLIKQYNISIKELLYLFENKEIDLDEVNLVDQVEVDNILKPFYKPMLQKIKSNKETRLKQLEHYKDKEGSLIYVIVATGNIYEDVVQAKAAASAGADVIAVIRTTGQSLLDYMPYGATTEGVGGTYATQENFRIMRKALDEEGRKLNRYIRLVNYASGLCMPEIASTGALERLDMMLNDSLYGILFRDINMKRTFCDQHFSRVINSYADIIINTGEDNYLTTSDAFEEAHTVLASQFINEQLALKAYIKEELMGLGHAFEINPNMKNGFLYELAQAQMAREIFPLAPLKYMPPTKHMTGNIFKGQSQNTLFNVVTTLTNQRIHLLGMMTEAIHTPFMSDRFLSIENANYISNNLQDLGNEIEFKKDGVIVRRAHEVLNQTVSLLEKISKETLFVSLEKGIFASIKRPIESGKGKDGVFIKSPKYCNPIIDRMIEELTGDINE